jgi:hypothetical protein
VWTTTVLPFLTATCFFASAILGRANKSKRIQLNFIGEALFSNANNHKRKTAVGSLFALVEGSSENVAQGPESGQA